MMGVHVFINSTVMSNDSIHSILTWGKTNKNSILVAVAF